MVRGGGGRWRWWEVSIEVDGGWKVGSGGGGGGLFSFNILSLKIYFSIKSKVLLGYQCDFRRRKK